MSVIVWMEEQRIQSSDRRNDQYNRADERKKEFKAVIEEMMSVIVRMKEQRMQSSDRRKDECNCTDERIKECKAVTKAIREDGTGENYLNFAQPFY